MTAIATLPNLVSKEFDGTLGDKIVGPDEAISIITTDRVDRDGEVVIPSGVRLSNYARNPVVMWGHARGSPSEGKEGLPIGRNVWIKPTKDGHGLFALTKFDTESDFASEVCGKVKRGIIHGWSITFIPKSYGPPTRDEVARRPDWADARRIYREVDLVEYSCVAAPANEDAVTVAKGVIPYHGYPEDDSAWDDSKARTQFLEYAGGKGDDFDPKKYAVGFAVVAGDPGNLTSYKFPHHYIKDGKVVTNRRAVASAIAAAHGARSGAKPEGADEALRHLLKHAEELGLPSGDGEEKKAMKEDDEESGEMQPDDEMDEKYEKMCKSAKKCFDGMKHGKGASLHAHPDKFELHHVPGEHGEEDEEEAPAHGEIRKAYADVPHVKSVHVSGKEPGEDSGYEEIARYRESKAAAGAAMTSSVGALGGFATGPETGAITDRNPRHRTEKYDPDRDNDDDSPGSLNNPDEAEDLAEELEESGGIRRYHYVKLSSGMHHKSVGRIHSIHTRGLVPHVENDVIATKESPHARVQLYKAYADGHLPTEIHVGHPISKMEKIDDLKPPTRKPLKPADREPVSKPSEKPKALAARSPLSEGDVTTAHVWALLRSGKIEEMIAKATDDALALVLGRG